MNPESTDAKVVCAEFLVLFLTFLSARKLNNSFITNVSKLQDNNIQCGNLHFRKTENIKIWY
jgi:hypothetical protein